MTNNKWQKITAFTVGGVLLGGLGGGLLFNDNAEVKKLTDDLEATELELEELQAQEPEVLEVEVDNGNLDLVLQHIYDNDGQVEYLTEDLDDDEISEIVDKIVFVNEVKDITVDKVRAELYDEVDKLEVSVGNSTVTLDEDDLKRLRIDDDSDELLFELDDWEDRDATVHVTGTFRQDDQRFNFELDAIFENGEFDELDNIVVTAR